MKKLTGTEKQVQWAEKIRSEWISNTYENTVDEIVDYYTDQRYTNSAIISIVKNTAEKLYTEIIENDSAVFWIENRGEELLLSNRVRKAIFDDVLKPAKIAWRAQRNR